MKEVTHMDCPKEWESKDDFDSHRPLLYLAAWNTDGRAIEFGAGLGSTELLRYAIDTQEREFQSFETNREWAAKTGATLVETYLSRTEHLSTTLFKPLFNIGLLFVDCAPAEIRKDIVWAYSELVDVIVVHDTEPGAEYVYGISDVLSKFKYRIDYRPEGKPHTTAVSNFIDIEKWLK